jgi:hypothetical protein
MTLDLSHNKKILILIIVGFLSFIGINLSGLSITSVTYQLQGKQILQGKQAPPVQVESPYLLQLKKKQDHKVSIDFTYKGYGNTALRLTPVKCLLPTYKINGQKNNFKVADRKDLCIETVVDLKNHLNIGANKLEVVLTAYETPRFKDYPFIVLLTAGAPLFGTDILQSTFSLILIACLASLIWISLKKSGCDFTTRVIFLTGCMLGFQWLHFIYQFLDSTDLDGHVAYINAMSVHFFKPYDYTGIEYWHPPLYYWICAIIIKLLDISGVIDPWTGVRFFSVLLRMVLLYYGMKCFKLFLKGHYFYLALALLAIWPSGIYQSNLISNDVFYYAFYAACFYYACLWHNTLLPQHLMKALILCGLGFTAKTSGAVPAFVLGATMLSNLVYGRCTFRYFFSRKILAAYFVIMLCILFNLGRWIYNYFWIKQGLPENYLGGIGNFSIGIDRLLSFEFTELMKRPFNLEQKKIYYLNFMITSILLTGLVWKAAYIASLLHPLHLVLLGYMVMGLRAITPNQIIRMTPLFYGVVLPFITLVTFLLVRKLIWCFDFRFIQPALIPMIILLMFGIKYLRKGRWKVLHYAGIITVIAFIQLSIVLFQLQMLS